MDNTQIKEGDIVYDTEFKEVFTFSRGDRFVIERLRLATEEEKKKLEESGEPCIQL